MKLVQSNKDFPDFTRLQALRYIFCQILGEKLENYDILSLWKTMSLSFPLFLKACKQRNDFKILQKKKYKSCSAIAILIAKRLKIYGCQNYLWGGTQNITRFLDQIKMLYIHMSLCNHMQKNINCHFCYDLRLEIKSAALLVRVCRILMAG